MVIVHTGIEHELQNAVETHIRKSVAMHSAALQGKGKPDEPYVSRSCESMLNHAVEKIAGNGLAGSVPPLEQLITACRDGNYVSHEMSMEVEGGFRAWAMSGLPKNVTGLILENSGAGWVVLLSYEDGECKEVCVSPWRNPDPALLPENLEAILKEKGFDFTETLVRQLSAQADDTLTFPALCSKIMKSDTGMVPWLYSAGSSAIDYYESGDRRIRMCTGNGNAARLMAFADTVYPILNSYNIPQPLAAGYGLAERALQADGGLIGPGCSLLLRDLVARHKGYALQEAANRYYEACSALEDAGCVPGMRGIYNDLDERMFTLRSEDGCSVLLGYENVSYIYHPREFLLVGYRDVESAGLMPSRLCVYPVYPDAESSGNMTARDMFEEGDGPMDVIEQLLWDTKIYSCSEGNPPRFGIHSLLEAFKAGQLTRPVATFHTATGLIELDDPLNAVIPACWGISTAIRWLCEGDMNADSSACLQIDERFSHAEPGVTV